MIHRERRWVATRADARFIRRCALFRGIRAAQLATLIRKARVREAKRGDVVVRQGDPSARVYCLLAGTGKLVRNGPKGEEIVLSFLWPGDAFGYVAALGGTNQQYTMQMTEDGRVLTWNADAITRMLRRSPALAGNVLRLIARRLEADWLRLQDLATEPVEQRVARALLRLARSKGETLPVIHQDLAEYVGTTPPTLSRILQRWKAQGLIDAGRANILIHQPAGLTAIAQDPPARSGM
jgi:CRP/FNR family transcriptional regulator, nitrogen oxide reductase regulator